MLVCSLPRAHKWKRIHLFPLQNQSLHSSIWSMYVWSTYTYTHTIRFSYLAHLLALPCLCTYTHIHTQSHWNDDKNSVLNARLSKRYQLRFALGKQSITGWKDETAIFINICNIRSTIYHTYMFSVPSTQFYNRICHNF